MIVARYLCLGVPVLALMGARFLDRSVAGPFLAFVAAAIGIAALDTADLYSFAAVDGTFRGMPVDLWIGWAVLWGPLPVMLRRVLPLPVMLGLLLWVDLIAMPALDPLVRLGPSWVWGEVLGLVVVALPAQLLGRWTADRRRLAGRALLQVAVFAGLTLWLVPTVAFTLGDGSWGRLTGMPAAGLFGVAQVALVIALPALAAVREFVTVGGGTPFPWDPPVRLVTSGPYAYMANPMQASATMLLLLISAVTGSVTLAVGAGLAALFSVFVAGPHETNDMRTRHAGDWVQYRLHVRDWRPRVRPYVPGTTEARLWLDDDCGPCSAVAGFLGRRAPVSLVLLPASGITRARYEESLSGVAAVAAGLERVHLGWAYAGWFLRLPVIGWLAQIIVDALIAPPHLAGTDLADT
ncbi:methyltransferase [Winogradskya humida]|uniref:Protein-S-isoprenylcysteine O-methyltransferase Ste14 n=1 Tax=Winogradskya humida TaxID=113566 RepID=A0ABQ3ZQJ0_9ACTN|nr:methyltransferase [Actinoplanes humidus]GIE20847.1 hypothetical protein Ahu01nite_039490 [Actinoplanes humidus]